MNLKKIKKVKWLNAAYFLASGAIMLGTIAWKFPDGVDMVKVARVIEAFGSVYREVSNKFVDDINQDEFMVAAFKAMLKTLDPYTTYIDQKDKTELDLLLQNQYGGAGINISERDSALFVTELLDNYPAKRSGLRIGDRIISINDTNLTASSSERMREIIRGKPGGELKFVIQRGNATNPLTFRLQRELIQAISIPYFSLIADSVGYIKLARFTQGSPNEFRNALAQIQSNGKINSLIIDLRENGGGLLESAVSIASTFMPKGTLIVSTKGKEVSSSKYFYTEDEPILKDVRVVVLVNKNSASASEILAGAVQDHDAGVLMGQPTFGKGLVQTLHWVGNDIQLKITTARYYTPTGRCIQKYSYDKNGKPVVTNDSLQHEFITSAGRNVKSSGGIFPDSLVSVDTTSINYMLYKSWAYFDYANILTSNLQSLPNNFSLTNEQISGFTKYLLSLPPKKLPENLLLRQARELEELAKNQGASQILTNKINDLKQESAKALNLSINANKSTISRNILREVLARFNTQKDRIEYGLSDDIQLQTAIKFLASKKNYFAILHREDKR